MSRGIENTKKDYSAVYAKLTRGIRGCKNGKRWLGFADRFFAGIVYAAYPVLLVFLFFRGIKAGEAAENAISAVLPSILIPGISFVILSIFRKKLNWKRPYEEWKIDALIHRDGTGCSMPSRHVFSAAVIAMCFLRQNILAGTCFLILAALIAMVRVLGGVHYPRDVIAGYLVGVAAGLLLFVF